VLLEEFGDDFVLVLQLLLERGDLAIFGVAGPFGGPLKSSSAVLKEQLLPVVEDSGVDLMLIANIGKRDFVDKMLSQDSDLFLRRVLFTRLSH
jgi:hypothetical protein